MTSDELDIVSTKELLDALKKRFDVFAMIGLLDKGSELKRENVSYLFRGEPFACLGTVDMLRAKIEQHLLRTIKDSTNE